MRSSRYAAATACARLQVAGTDDHPLLVGLDATHQRAHACQELAGVAGLDEVVVGSGEQPGRDVD
jgi:hypothetical protein